MSRFSGFQNFRNESGNIAILFGFSAILVFLSIAYTIDVGRTYLVKRQTQNAVDAATMSAAAWHIQQLTDPNNTMTTSQLDTQTKTIALHLLDYNLRAAGLTMYNANLADLLAGYNNVATINIRNDAKYGKVLDIAVALPMKTILFGKQLKWNKTSMTPQRMENVSGAINSLELSQMAVALTFDVSGSMDAKELRAVKDAGIAFVSHMYPGDYVSINTFNKTFDETTKGGKTNLVLPMTKILSSAGAGGKTKSQINSIINADLDKFGPLGTYGQGGLYQARVNFETGLKSKLSSLEYDNMRKYIVFATDGDFSVGTKSNADGSVRSNAACDYEFVESQVGTANAPREARFSGRAGTIEQADLARDEGIEVLAICSRGYCNFKGTDPVEFYLVDETRQFMRRVAGDIKMIPETKADGHPWRRSKSSDKQIANKCAYYPTRFSGTLAKRTFIIGTDGASETLETEIEKRAIDLNSQRGGKLIK